VAASADFPARSFVRRAKHGLDELELRARVDHTAHVLRACLPDDFGEALDIVLRAGESWKSPGGPVGGFAAWPIIEMIGFHGIEHYDASLCALRELTHLFSSEFAIRPYIEHDPKKALRCLRAWSDDPREHVRRLVSEGTRPRLPWGTRLRMFQRDPKPVLLLLERLKDDPSEYVRRSVANNLNDIAKDNPDAMLAVCKRWSKKANTNRAWIIRHATRSLVKQGHPVALEILGYDANAAVVVRKLRVQPATVALGEDVSLSFELHSKSKSDLPLVVDYVVHHVKKNGRATPKVFKLKNVTLPGGTRMDVHKVHRLRPISTRTYYAGRHTIEITVNGKAGARATFELTVS
jgi:3-methyladenine DNA glycosylase AlkC